MENARRTEFLDFIQRNFNVSGEFIRLLNNVLDYTSNLDTNNQPDFLCSMLDGTIGINFEEIKSFFTK